MKLRRIGATLLALMLLIVPGAPHTQAQSNPLVWAAVMAPGPTGVNYNSVYMLDTNTAWLVGSADGLDKSSGLAERRTLINGRWQGAEGWGFDAPLNAVVAISQDNVWAVGDDSEIVHWDGSNWQSVASPIPGAKLNTIQMLGNGEEGWIGGGSQPQDDSYSHPVLLHYQAGKWQSDNSITGLSGISSLHFAPGDGWAVGPGVWHYHHNGANGAWWGQEEEPHEVSGTYDSLNGVQAISDSEAWVVGSYTNICGICVGHAYVIHRSDDKGWQQVVPGEHDGGIDNPYNQTHDEANSRSSLGAVTFSSTGYGVAVGYETLSDNTLASYNVPLIISYSGGRWRYELIPTNQRGSLAAVALADDSHILAVGYHGLIMSYGYGNQTTQPPAPQPIPNPATHVSDPHDPSISYFAPTGHTLRGAFKQYWERFGGLAQFGYPLTEEFQELSPTDGKSYTVQYFERNRFEFHPEIKPPQGQPPWADQVLLGLLGRTITAGREGETAFRGAARLPSPASYFAATSHNLSGGFKQYWLDHGGLAQFGYPISEEFREINPSDGLSYTVQYFERNRFEFHPELPDPYKVSLGLLGAQVLQQRGWLP